MKKKENKQTIVKKKTTENYGVITFLIMIIALIVIFALLLVPWRTVTTTEQVPYDDVENYYVQEPYTTTQTFYELVPDSVQGYKIPNYGITTDYLLTSDGQALVGCTITNKESVSVRYTYYIYTSYSNTTFEEPKETHTITIEGDDMFRDQQLIAAKTYYGCRVEPDLIKKDEKTVIFKNVTVERDVTSYREVVKTRDVVKLKNVTVKTQENWILGVRMPWMKEWTV